MINAEAIITNKGTYSNGTWSNVSVQLRYPNALPNGTQQNNVNNRLTVNDIIVDNNGFSWKVTSCSYSGSNDYLCTLTQQGVTPTQYMEPNTILEKGIVTTPNIKGLVSPYYHDSYVSTNAFRAALSYNMGIYIKDISGPIPTNPGTIQKLFKSSHFLFINDNNNYTWMLGHSAFGAPLNLYTGHVRLLKNNTTNEVFKIKYIDGGIFSAYSSGVPASFTYSSFPFIRNTDFYSYISCNYNEIKTSVLGHNEVVDYTSIYKQDGEQTCTKIVNTAEGLYLKLTTDGSVLWGGNGTILSQPTRNYYTQFGTNYYMDIASGYDTVYLLLLDGTLNSYGNNSLYQRGIIGTVDYVGSKKFKKIYSYMDAVYAIDQDDFLWHWGRDGQLLLKNTRSDNTGYTALPMQISTSLKFTKVSIGRSHCAALTTTGDVYTWGVCSYYCIGNNIDDINTSISTPYLLASNCIDCEAMTQATTYYVTATGELYGLGRNSYNFGINYMGHEYLVSPTKII